MIDLSRFKVVYGDKVLNAVFLESYEIREYPHLGETSKFKQLTVIAVNEDGNLVAICDEAWRFQFIPIIGRSDGK